MNDFYFQITFLEAIPGSGKFTFHFYFGLTWKKSFSIFACCFYANIEWAKDLRFGEERKTFYNHKKYPK